MLVIDPVKFTPPDFILFSWAVTPCFSRLFSTSSTLFLRHFFFKKLFIFLNYNVIIISSSISSLKTLPCILTSSLIDGLFLLLLLHFIYV